MKHKLSIKNNILYLFYILLFCLGLVLPSKGQAAEMFFASSDQKPGLGEVFKVDFFVNAKEESINALAGKVIFPSSLIELKEVRAGNSIVSLWVENPELKSNGQINFSGVIPGGYKGENGLLFSLMFRVLKSGPVNIKVIDGQVLLNDGQGTADKFSSSVLTLSAVAKNNSAEINYGLMDKIAPEVFVPEVAKDKSIEEGKWFIVFATQDKQSGIDHYEVQENKNSQSNSLWQKAVSPYILHDQTLRSYIFVKAIDKSGNATEVVVNPKNLRSSYKKLLFYGIVLLVAIIFGILRPKLWRKKGD